MGRFTGFVGGAVLSSSIIYFATSQLSRRAQRNSHTLRESRQVLEAIVEPSKRSTAIQPYREPPKFSDNMKHKWNTELQNAYRWLSSLDATVIRERSEDITGNIYKKIVSQSA